MPTARLVPSTYYLSSTSYLSVTNASNMYADTDSTNYATVYNSRSSTSSYYIYLRGFDFDSIPAAAVVSSFTVKLKAYESGVSTSSSYKPYLANGTTAINGSCSAITTTASVHEFTGISDDWDTISGYGDNFGIRINCRRASRNTAGYVYIYGAEIEVSYTVPDPRTITTTLTGDGTISPSGSTTTYDGEEFELTITPTNSSDTVTATKNGVDITADLVAHGAETSASRVLGAFTLVSGSFNSGESYFEGLEGSGHTATGTTSNYYSGSSSTQAVFQYDMSFSIPSNATVTRCYFIIKGHAESTSQSSEYMTAQLKSGSTELFEMMNFKDHGTSNTEVTVECDVLPTPEQLQGMVLECRLGYYGGAICGATCYVEYDTGGGIDHYTYTYTVSGDATISVVIGTQRTDTLYVKVSSSWAAASRAWKKVGSSWVLQSDLSTVFDESKNYVRGT